MLSVFAGGGKAIMDLPDRQLAQLSIKLYDGIRDVIRETSKQTMVLANAQVRPFETAHTLKPCFFAQWVSPFKPTSQQLAILFLIDQPDLDIRAHEQQVKEALRIWKCKSYLQRSGESSTSFLTDKEKECGTGRSSHHRGRLPK